MDEQEMAVQETDQNVQTADGGTKGQQTEDTGEKAGALQKFISGLFGGGKEAAEEGGKAAQKEIAAETKEKSFTQAELDAAVEAAKKKWAEEAAEAERVKKLSPEERTAEEQKKKDARIAELEGQLLKKELRETAVRTLEKEGYPAGLAGVLDYSGKEQMEESLKSTMQIFKESLSGAIQTRLKGKTPEGLGGAASAENLLRDQIAKNIRGL